MPALGIADAGALRVPTPNCVVCCWGMGGLVYRSSCHVVLARQGRRALCACGLAAVYDPVTACAAPCLFGSPGNSALQPE